MRTLNNEDAFFLYMETPEQHQHTIGTLVLDPASAPAGFSIEHIANKLESVINTRTEFRQKLMRTPFSITPPVLVEDSHYRFANHVHYIGAAPPGDEAALATLVQDIASTPLDQSRPLWEAWLVSGLQDNKLALVFKSHHCLSDAAHGMEFMAQLLDTEAKLSAGVTTRQRQLNNPPPAWLVTYEALKSQWHHQPRYRDVIKRTWRSVRKRRQLFDKSNTLSDLVPGFLESAPKLKVNKAITSLRSAAMDSVSLDSVKQIKNQLGVTVNDVVVAACTLALRDYLIATDDLPDQPLVCYVPVSLTMKGRQKTRQDQGNQVGTMAIRLPVQQEQPAEVVAAVNQSTLAAKTVFDASFENLLLSYIGAVPPSVADWALKQYLSRPIVERAPPAANVVISNFPGPPMALYMAGAKLEACFPMGPIINGQGPNITFMSCAGKLQFSVQACRAQVPDASIISDAIVMAFATLSTLAEESEANKGDRRSGKASVKRRPGKRAKRTAVLNPAARGKKDHRRSAQTAPNPQH